MRRTTEAYEHPVDRVHLNSIEPAGDRVIVSLRNTDGVYGIDRATGEIVWKLGGQETPESLRVIGDYYEYPSGAQHDARVLPDGTISVFDNRSGLDQPPRVTRWRIDEEKMTANAGRGLRGSTRAEALRPQARLASLPTEASSFTGVTAT